MAWNKDDCIKALRAALYDLMRSSIDMAYSEPDRPSHEDTRATFEGDLSKAQQVLMQTGERIERGA